jgi:hypothetical protein
MNKKFNYWYAIVSLVILLILIVIDHLFQCKINREIYYVLLGLLIAAIGNYVVVIIQERR